MASAAPPVSLPDEATLLRAVESAVRAPSVYNSQPWRWRADAAIGIDLFADRDRHLITIDADGRDLLVSAQTGSGKTVAYGLAFAPTLPSRTLSLTTRCSGQRSWRPVCPATNQAPTTRCVP